jgi:hypothetical protein
VTLQRKPTLTSPGYLPTAPMYRHGQLQARRSKKLQARPGRTRSVHRPIPFCEGRLVSAAASAGGEGSGFVAAWATLQSPHLVTRLVLPRGVLLACVWLVGANTSDLESRTAGTRRRRPHGGGGCTIGVVSWRLVAQRHPRGRLFRAKRSAEGGIEGVDLVALLLEEACEYVFEGSLSVA